MNNPFYYLVPCRFCKVGVPGSLLWNHWYIEHPLEAKKIKVYLSEVANKEKLLREVL